MRLDRYLSNFGLGTRKEVKDFIRGGRVMIDGEIIKEPDTKLSDSVQVLFEGKEIKDTTFHYYMLNKPAGVLSATEDNYCSTVIDLMEGVHTEGLFPVGRLDKDTEGLLLITDNGVLAHSLLSPRKHVNKQYYVKLNECVAAETVKWFAEGLKISEGFVCLPAVLEVLSDTEVLLTIQEGKFHQVKRMFASVQMEVIYLKRLSMGSLVLDEDLKPGEFRPLRDEEIEALMTAQK